MQLGFIGLGIMGASMAANLQKAGYALVVHDVRRSAATLSPVSSCPIIAKMSGIWRLSLLPSCRSV